MKQAADPIPETAPTGTARRAVRFLAKLGLVVLAGIGLGIAAYYGFPAVYSGFVQPVQINTQRIAEVETSLESELDASFDRLEALNERIQLLRAMELVLRARLALADNNPGLAGQDLRRARGVLASATAPQDWAPIVDRLDMALSNLNTAPLVAVQDVEAAWYLMLEASAP